MVINEALVRVVEFGTSNRSEARLLLGVEFIKNRQITPEDRAAILRKMAGMAIELSAYTDMLVGNRARTGIQLHPGQNNITGPDLATLKEAAEAYDPTLTDLLGR